MHTTRPFALPSPCHNQAVSSTPPHPHPPRHPLGNPDDGDFYQELRKMLGMQPEGAAAGGAPAGSSGAGPQAAPPSKQVGMPAVCCGRESGVQFAAQPAFVGAQLSHRANGDCCHPCRLPSATHPMPLQRKPRQRKPQPPRRSPWSRAAASERAVERRLRPLAPKGGPSGHALTVPAQTSTVPVQRSPLLCPSAPSLRPPHRPPCLPRHAH